VKFVSEPDKLFDCATATIEDALSLSDALGSTLEQFKSRE
jgi:hypothetical protein